MAKQLISALLKNPNKNNIDANSTGDNCCGNKIIGIIAINDNKQPPSKTRLRDAIFSDKKPKNGDPINQPKKIIST
jgi:hypothetical protein